MTNTIILKFITLIHSLIVVFVLLTPFFGSNQLLILHSITIPFIVLHWIVNQTTCAITLTERLMRRKLFGNDSADDCISCKIIQPVYDFKMNNSSNIKLIYLIAGILWTISMSRLFYSYKYNNLTIRELFVN